MRITYSEGISTSTWKYEPPKEKAIKIKVTKGEDYQEKEAKKEETKENSAETNNEFRVADNDGDEKKVDIGV